MFFFSLEGSFAVAAINNFNGWSSPLQYRTGNTAFTDSGVQKVHLKLLNVLLSFNNQFFCFTTLDKTLPNVCYSH
jgi:hypothetical protein